MPPFFLVNRKKLTLRAGQKGLFSAAHPTHVFTVTVQQQIAVAERLDAEPPPGKPGRMRSLLLIQQDEKMAAQSRALQRGESSPK